LKQFYKWFTPISIVLLPLAFFCIVPAWSVEDARFDFYLFQFEF
jgi:hypothetical protein